MYKRICNLNLDFFSTLDKEPAVLVESEAVSKCKKKTQNGLERISITATLETN